MSVRKCFPTLNQVEKVAPKQLKFWKKYLPGSLTEDERKVIERISARLKKKG